MAYAFGDGFDCYAAPADAVAGYWDSGTTGFTLVAGRFSGSQAISSSGTSATTGYLVKSSASNDAIHHIAVAINQSVAITGTNSHYWLTLSDGATAQCTVVFRSDGAILLQSGASNGTTLATYTGALTASSTWYQFEIEVRVSNTAGYMAVRKLGNTSNDYTSATNLDTAGGTANDYASRLSVGVGAGGAGSQILDDLLWRSDTVANGVAWVGDIRCSTRRPTSDASVQWTPSSPALPYIPFAFSSNQNNGTSTAWYTPYTPPVSGNVGTVSFVTGAVNAGNTKCTIFSTFGSAPGTPLGSATTLTNMPAGANTFTFGTPVAVTAGTRYWVGIMSDTNSIGGHLPSSAVTSDGQSGTAVTYAAFPGTNPVTGNARAVVFTINITVGAGGNNAAMVQEAQQDAATSYVYSSTVGQADLYRVSAITSTPASTVMVVTRAYCQKSDAGTRTLSVQLKSGSTTVSSTPATALNTVWGWVSRTDTTDPATGAAWTPTAVNNAQVGVTVVA